MQVGLYSGHNGVDFDNAVELVRKADSLVGELKREACLRLGIKEEAIEEYNLYRVDGFDEPSERFKREKQAINTAAIDTGDYLCVKNKTHLLSGEKIFVHLLNSHNGDPDGDPVKVGELQVSLLIAGLQGN